MKTIAVTTDPLYLTDSPSTSWFKQLIVDKQAELILLVGPEGSGKTSLIEQNFRDWPILKFEGVESSFAAGEAYVKQFQIKNILKKLAIYAEEPKLSKLNSDNWGDLFRLIGKLVRTGPAIIYFANLEAIADMQGEFLEAFVGAYPEAFRTNPQLRIIFGTKSYKFVDTIQEYLSQRGKLGLSIQYLRPPSLGEVQQMLGRDVTVQDAILALLLVGTSPRRLRKFSNARNILETFAELSFLPDSYFANLKYACAYRDSQQFVETIIKNMVEQLFFSKPALLEGLGKLSILKKNAIFEWLSTERVINKIYPINLAIFGRNECYELNDIFARTYYHLIVARRNQIFAGNYSLNPVQALVWEELEQVLKLNFKTLIRQASSQLARHLGYDPTVARTGSLALREQMLPPDLIILDPTGHLTLVEAVYSMGQVDLSEIGAVEAKEDQIRQIFNKKTIKKIDRVLVTTWGGSAALIESGYFSRIIGAGELLTFL